MKTTKSSYAIKTLTYMAVALFLFLTSCKDNETIDYTATDNTNLQTESNSEAELEDASDISSIAMSADGATLTGSRSGETSGNLRSIKDKITDARFSCATVELDFANDNVPASPGTAANPHGFITIDFGTGCTSPNGRIRKGKIVIEFKGRRFLPGSYVKITFEGYYVNGVKVEGMRLETNISGSTEENPTFRAETTVTVTFPDGTTATRTGDRTRVWNRAANPLNDTWTVTGGAFGKTRKGKEYVMTITKALIFKRSCAITNKVVMPVEGTKELVTENKKITIDFGTGECDTKVTVTINGKSKEVTVADTAN
ncbi:MAG: hypothetical protein SH819_06895 [Cytophagales bacterium]|nr:hypothetical protein [Cytophagales bacterium]